MEMPQDIVNILLVGTALTFLLIVLLPIQKALAQRRAKSYRRRASCLEDFMLRLAIEPGEEISEELPHILRDHNLAGDFIQGQLHYLKGCEKLKIRSAFEKSGVVDRYEKLLKSRRPDSRAEATEILGELGYLPLVTHVAENLSTAKRGLTTISARALTRLVEDLRYRSGASWQEILESALGSAVALETLIANLTGLLRGADRWTETVILEALSSLGELSHQKIIEALDDPDETYRATCANACGRLQVLSSLPKLTELLEDESPNVRARACAALGVLGDVRAADRLVPKTTEARWPVRAQAVKALGLLGDEKYLPTVKAALKDSSWWVRTNAVEALANFEKKGVWVLFEVLHGDDHYARERAAHKLQHLGAIQKLVDRWLDKGDPSDRRMMINFSRTGFFSSLLSRFHTRPDQQRQILELIEEVFVSFRADLESGVERRFSLSSRALKRMKRDLFPDKVKRLKPEDAGLRAEVEQLLNLYRNLQELSQRQDHAEVSSSERRSNRVDETDR